MLAGGIAGSAARAAIGHLLASAPTGFPSGTLAVNLAGSLLLGLFLARRERAVSSSRWPLRFWAVGLLGSFTTFSAFSIEVVHLLEADRALLAGGYVIVSLVGGLSLALLGQRVGSAIG